MELKFRINRMLLPLLSLLAMLTASSSHAGLIEDRDGKTIIHVRVFDLPDPGNPETANRAELASLNSFKKDFARIFTEKYRDKYQADPGKYGKHNWDNVEIQLDRFSGIRIEGVEVDLLAIAGGMAPDILYVNFRKSETYIQNNFLYPLDKPEDNYLSAMSKEDLDFRVHPKIWQVIKRAGPEGSTNVWAFPYGGTLGKVVFYRKDLFAANKIPYPTPNWTWNDMLDAAKKISNPGKGIYGMLLTRSKHEAAYWMSFLWSAGGEAVDIDPVSGTVKCVFGSPQAATALDFYLKLSSEKWTDKEGRLRRGYSAKDAASVSSIWEEGRIGMMFGYIDEKLFAKIDPEVTGIVPVPIGPDGNRASELNSRMMGLFSSIKDPAVRDAAWEYILYYDSKAALAVKTKVMVEGGLGRFVNPKYLMMFGFPEIVHLCQKDLAEIYDIAVDTGKPEPFRGNSNLIYEMLTKPIQEAEQLSVNDKLPADEKKRTAMLHDMLSQACIRANEQMMGIIPEKERLIRRISAGIALILIAITFAFVFRRIIKAFSPKDGVPVSQNRRLKKLTWCYLLLLPALLTVFIWQYVPLARGSVMAFQDYKLLGRSPWAGLDNFGDVIFDGVWWNAVLNSLRYSFLVLSLTFIPPIILAIFLQEIPRGKIMFRALYYLPAVMTGLVTILLWKQFYEPSEHGVINAILMHIPAIGFIVIGIGLLSVFLICASRLNNYGKRLPAFLCLIAGVLVSSIFVKITLPVLFPHGEQVSTSLSMIVQRLFCSFNEPFHWLSDPDISMLSCVIPMVWAGIGPGCLIYLAALKSIPEEYYESAEIDGANFIDKILFIVVPHLKIIILINFIGAFIATWYNATGNILVMTGGAANTEVAGLHIWYKAFTFLKFGPASAMAWLLGFLLIGFTLHQLKMLSKVEFKSTATDAKEK